MSLEHSPAGPARALRLRGGVEIPSLGLGVFRASPAETRAAVRAALQAGYRHVDTAQVYGNEEDVGAAIRESGLPREQVFVTTKLWNAEQGEERALAAFEQSRRRLGLEVVDLFLLHWPVQGLRVPSWRAPAPLSAPGRRRGGAPARASPAARPRPAPAARAPAGEGSAAPP